MRTSTHLFKTFLYFVVWTALASKVSQECCAEPQFFKVSKAEFCTVRRLIGAGKFSDARQRSLALIERYPHDDLLYATFVEVSLYSRTLEQADAVLTEKVSDGQGIEQCLYGLGLVRFYQHRYKEALQLFQKAVECGNTKPDCFRYLSYTQEKVYGSDEAIRRLSLLCHERPGNALNWYALGLAYWGKRDFEEALHALEEAVSRDRMEPAFKQGRAAVAFLSGHLSEPEKTLLSLLSEAEETVDLTACQFIRSYLLMLHSSRGDEEGWRSILETTVSKAREFGLAKWQGWANEKLADFSLWHGMPDLAVRSAQESLTASRLCGDESLVVTASIRLFEAYIELGQYMNASRTLLGRLKGMSRSTLDPDSIRALLDVARLYHEIGQDNFSIVFAVEGLFRAKAIKSAPSLLFLGTTILGSAYQGLGDTSSAEKSFAQAEMYAKEVPRNAFFLALAKGNIGNAYLMGGRIEDAGQMFREQGRRARLSNFRREVAFAEFNLGEYRSKRWDDAHAKRFYVNAHQLATEQHLVPIVMVSAYRLARIAAREHNIFESISYFRQVVELVDSLVADLVGVGGPTGVQMTGIDACREISVGYARLGRLSEAVQWAEESRRREFQATRRFACKTCRHIIDSVLSFNGIESFATLAAHVYDRADGSPDSRIHDLIDLLVAEVSFPRPCMNEMKPCCTIHTAPFEMEHLIELTKHGDAVFSFTVADECILIIAAAHGELSGKIIPISRLELRKMVCRAFSSERTPSTFVPATGMGGDTFDWCASLNLCGVLFDSTAEAFADCSRWTIIADDELRAVPFEALVTGTRTSVDSSVTGRLPFLIDRHEIRYDISIELLTQNLPLRPQRAVLLVGNEEPRKLEDYLLALRNVHDLSIRLPGIKREVKVIESLFPTCSDILYGEEATKGRFKELAPFYSVVHVAAHAKQDLSVPLHCAIDFVTRNDGLIEATQGWTAWEAAGVTWNASLVVLSACNTVAGSHGIGPSGFVGALREAGVASIIGTLWDVDDATTPNFMSSFYRQLRNMKSPAAALRNAKLESIRAGESPILWAGFVAYGRSEEIPALVTREHERLWSGESRVVLGLYALIFACGVLCGWQRERLLSRHLKVGQRRKEQAKKNR